MHDPEIGIPGYDEHLNSDFIDPDPNFRETLRLLNAGGVHTVSSCQGHAPGTQYDHVQEWMAPYITCRASIEDRERTIESLKLAGGDVEITTSGKVLARFPRNWEWRRSADALRSRFRAVP